MITHQDITARIIEMSEERDRLSLRYDLANLVELCAEMGRKHNRELDSLVEVCGGIGHRFGDQSPIHYGSRVLMRWCEVCRYGELVSTC